MGQSEETRAAKCELQNHDSYVVVLAAAIRTHYSPHDLSMLQPRARRVHDLPSVGSTDRSDCLAVRKGSWWTLTYTPTSCSCQIIAEYTNQWAALDQTCRPQVMAPPANQLVEGAVTVPESRLTHLGPMQDMDHNTKLNTQAHTRKQVKHACSHKSSAV